MGDLNPKQRAFVSEFLKDRNATQAAIRAGYSKKTARVQASDLLTKPDIKAAVDAGIIKAEEKAIVDASYVLTRLRECAERCMQAEEIYDKLGHATGIWRFDSSGATRSLELLGKHLKLFTDRMEVELVDNIAERLKEARLRRAVTNGNGAGHD